MHTIIVSQIPVFHPGLTPAKAALVTSTRWVRDLHAFGQAQHLQFHQDNADNQDCECCTDFGKKFAVISYQQTCLT